jgi:hypothetical protein
VPLADVRRRAVPGQVLELPVRTPAVARGRLRARARRYIGTVSIGHINNEATRASVRARAETCAPLRTG